MHNQDLSDEDYPDSEAVVSILIDKKGRIKTKSAKGERVVPKANKPGPKTCKIFDSGVIWWIRSNPKITIYYMTPDGQMRHVEVDVP